MIAPTRFDLASLSLDDLATLREALRTKPGQRSLETQVTLRVRDDLIREYATRYYPGRSRNEQSRCVARDLNRYEFSAWQNARAADECPHRDPCRQLLWRILKAWPVHPKASRISQILSRSPATQQD